MITRHSAVRLDNFIIIFGGFEGFYDDDDDNQLLSTYARLNHVIWTYNLYTEEWRSIVIPNEREAPEPFFDTIAVVIEGKIYTFGGASMEHERRNALWTLSKTERGRFTWSFVKYRYKDRSPSPRNGHTGWEYAGKLWVFGGVGPSPKKGYLNCHGNIAESYCGLSENNQLLSYNPNTKMWTNPQCFGVVPTPCWGHATAIIRSEVFLFGGFSKSLGDLNDFLQLDMDTLIWTTLEFGQFIPKSRHSCSLTATSDNHHLILHGGHSKRGKTLSDTWITDRTTCTWEPYTPRKDHCRQHHTATSGVNNNIIIIGGYKDKDDTYDAYNEMFCVMLEPRSLQEVTSYIIHMYKAYLPWKCLPKKLIAQLGICADG